jgi:hypothetical protein
VASGKFLDCFVVHKPTGMDVVHERGNLLLTGIHPILVGSKHTGITCPYNDTFFQITPWEYDEGAERPSPISRPGSSRYASFTPER